MKRTELEKKERELKRSIKKVEVLDRKSSKLGKASVGEAIDALHSLLFHDGTHIYNTEKDDNLVEFLMDMKENQAEKDWEAILRKAIRKTEIKEKEEGYLKIKAIFDSL